MNALMKVEEGILDDVLGQGFVLGDEKGGPNRPHLVAAHQFSNPPMSPPFMRRTASSSSRATPGMVARIGNTRRGAERLGWLILRGPARICQGAGPSGQSYQDCSGPNPRRRRIGRSCILPFPAHLSVCAGFRFLATGGRPRRAEELGCVRCP